MTARSSPDSDAAVSDDHRRTYSHDRERADRESHPREVAGTWKEVTLYEISEDPQRKEFLDDLFMFMQKRGTPVNRIPIMAKQTLDLYELYKLVVSKGGLVEVINKKIWREITKGLNLPSSITSAAFTLRTQYMKYLYPYECIKMKLSNPEELQAAIDGNRREGRRSSYGAYDIPLSPTGISPSMVPSSRHINGNGSSSHSHSHSHHMSSMKALMMREENLGSMKMENTHSAAVSSSGEEENHMTPSMVHQREVMQASIGLETLRAIEHQRMVEHQKVLEAASR
ncbi:PREDICTED: AT-rich interactive domain-containing protein 3A-like [Priapulus caudatus]|uniref:AT-rich interactive domain-containing protein 3A-like n=1 Tax=Priapulus caudatus TaxID=37621 RepID=A0ABM1E5G6_PRICU|nr:PREDICTED: AT-rich interactive domain-containing protein 3A-like [Priapulus caudatus]